MLMVAMLVLVERKKRKEDYPNWQFTYLKSILLIDDDQIK